MKILIFLLLAVRSFAAFSEFYVQPTGSNLNAGYKATDDAGAIDDTATYTYSGGTFTRSTGVFTVAAGNPSSDGVDVGDFASIYTTAGATVATFVARITARDTTTITVSLSAIAGAATAVSETAAAATCKIGGAWAGPSGAVGFPIGFAVGTMRNVAGSWPRVNFKAGTYNITAPMVANKAGPITFQGYQTTAGDGVNKGLQDTSSKAIIDGGTSGAVSYYNLLQVSSGAQNNTFTDFIFTHNGGTGSVADGVAITENENMLVRCVFHDLRRHGIQFLGVGHLIECEAYACNQANDSTNSAAISFAATGCVGIRCIAHDNVGSNCDGFAIGGNTLIECIAESNGRHGAKDFSDNINTLLQCDFYNNGAAGVTLGTGASAMIANIQNCNFVKNTTYGIQFVSTTVLGTLHNCGFGSGTQANGSGAYSTVNGLDIILTNLGSGSADGLYAANVTPWTDPANGDFRISLAAAKNAGRGKFATFNMGANTTLGYPDIGSNQHYEAAAPLGSASFFQLFQ